MKTIELDITQKEYEQLAILSLRQGVTVGEYLIKHIDTTLMVIEQSQYNNEIDTLLLFLTRDENIENLEDFLYWLDDVEKLQQDLKEHQNELEQIRNARVYDEEEQKQKQEDIDDMEQDIQDIKKDIATSQAYVDDWIEKYKKHNPAFDLDSEIKQCREWLVNLK